MVNKSDDAQCRIPRGNLCSHWLVMRPLRLTRTEGLYDLSGLGLVKDVISMYYTIFQHIRHTCDHVRHILYKDQDSLMQHFNRSPLGLEMRFNWRKDGTR